MPDAYELFADVLDYPGLQVLASVKQCIALVAPRNPIAAEKLMKFEATSSARSLGWLQELYAKTFDFEPDGTPNTSYHLFGDDWRRSVFLAELKGIYESNSFETGSELPDHLCLVLRFLALKGRGQQSSELVEECIIPAVRHMLLAVGQEDNPYKDALDALLIWLAADGIPNSNSQEGEKAAGAALET